MSILRIQPNTIVTGDLYPISLPNNNGNYLINIQGSNRSCITPAQPMIKEYSFVEPYITDNMTYKFENIPNGKYLMMLDIQAVNWNGECNGKFAMKYNGEYVMDSYLFNKCENLHDTKMITVKNNTIDLVSFARNCENYMYNKMKLTLIPVY